MKRVAKVVFAIEPTDQREQEYARVVAWLLSQGVELPEFLVNGAAAYAMDPN